MGSKSKKNIYSNSNHIYPWLILVIDGISYNWLLAWKKGLCFVVNFWRVHTRANFGLLFSQKPHQTNCCHPLACLAKKNLYHKHIYTFWMRVIDVCKKTFKVRKEVYKNDSWLLALDLQSMTSGKKTFSKPK